MISQQYKYTAKVQGTFEEVVETTREELMLQGFSIVSELDVKAILKQKLDVDYTEYIIFGACTPALAHDILNIEKDAGLLLPCSVVVYEKLDEVYVAAIAPTVMMSIVQNSAVVDVARNVEARLQAVVVALSEETVP